MIKVKLPYLIIMICCVAMVLHACTKDKIPQPEINTVVSFKNDIYPVFASSAGHCSNTGCHSAEAGAIPPLMYSVDSCYTSLLRDTDLNSLGYKYVNTAHPDSSLLYIMLTSSNPPTAERMPEGGPYLSSEFTDKVLKWIQQGAQNN